MIRLVTGNPGAGKTYHAVRHMVNEYFTYDKDSDMYFKKKEKKDVTIFANIEGLQLDHIDLKEAIERSGKGVEGFFTEGYQKQISKKYKKIVYIIDECQRYFPKRFKETETMFYFEYHRHLGHDIYLISQDRFRVCREISSLADFEIRAVKRTLSIFGEMKYNVLSDGEIIDRKVVKPNKRIFKLYKSMVATENEKIKNPFLKYIIVPILSLAISIPIFLHLLKPSESNAKQTESTEILAPQPGQREKNKIKNKKTYKKNGPVDRWVRAKGVVHIDNVVYRILDPDTNELLPPSMIKYPKKMIGRDCFLYMPVEEKEEKIDSFNNRYYARQNKY
jgi:hypothetical protein